MIASLQNNNNNNNTPSTETAAAEAHTASHSLLLLFGSHIILFLGVDDDRMDAIAAGQAAFFITNTQQQ